MSISELLVVDYGLGNLKSIENALAAIGATYRFTKQPDEVRAATKLLLPGVGAYSIGMQNLESSGLASAIRDSAADGAFVLGICLGMQLLLDEGVEGGCTKGLGLISGRVKQLEAPIGLRIPHMGFNKVRSVHKTPLVEEIPDCSDFYFVHSYRAAVSEEKYILAITVYGEEFPSIIGGGNVFGTQFHPEKSQSQGLKLLKNFCRL